MRVITRLHACFAAAIVLVLYFSYTRASSHLQDRIHHAWTPATTSSTSSGSHRLVVFGDDWSDNGEYRVSPPPKSTTRNRDPDRGDMWTEALCKELACDSLENFARSIPTNVGITTIGSVVDSDIFANVTAGTRNETLALFDFRTQVQQFIEFDKTRQVSGDGDDKWTIFTVFFGIWDLLEYSVLDKSDAMHAMDRSVEELFHNLNLLADYTGGSIRAVIPKVVDVTFLPRFQMRKNKSDVVFAHDQHQSVFLWTYWNTALSQAAAEWKGGDIYMPDLNSIVMDQVREQQLYSKQISDAAGIGKQIPLFDEVVQPCLSLKAGNGDTDLQAAAADVEKCFDPARHLFWDSMHLSGPAHELIGKATALLVTGNTTVNHGQAGSAPDQKNDKKEDARFKLKFPPGY
ncbi:hypothetical protein K505DRAFT_155678 [Melanomma pulvis-pyrius CBS 109.77]|uniref:Carbohydrate esterase family 16 protein n=1 Tax=Melanomma pulvis-pyrius CBS 109.77 TaxID=1314802 RepID=A0A6A6XJV5_9PLEO|nr:hypothetical protein K505DRAFT_155678 [Melanomma pulvis-pyrius CBS 109.77]